MRLRPLFLASAALAAGLAAPLAAQDKPAETRAGAMAERMADLATQKQAAMMLRAMTEVLLDMPVAPMVEAMNEMEADAAGTQPKRVDPDLTLRKMAPQASRVPEAVEKAAPRVMGAMGAMAEGFDRMAPQMREMARRMEEALPPASE